MKLGRARLVAEPELAEPLVALGQTMVAGETVLADLHSDEGPRPGEVR